MLISAERRVLMMNPVATAGIYVAAIVLAEIAAVVWGVEIATVGDAVLVAALLSHFTFKMAGAESRHPVHPGRAVVDPALWLLPVLALLPLLRILSVTMPIQRAAELSWYALVGVPLLLSVVLTLRLLEINFTHIGLTRHIPAPQSAIAWSGLPLGLLAYWVGHPQGLVEAGHYPRMFAGVIIIFVFSGMAEELLFRGLLQRYTVMVFGRAGMPITAVLFAVMYLGTRSGPYVLFIFGVGLLFGWCVQRTGSLWGVAISHGVMNVTALLILPLLWP